MLKEYQFFDSGWNKDGEFQNDYDLKSINGDKVVIDHATDLMWHQSGSGKSMEWNQANGWVRSLNSRRYAGFNDWRLPTLDEAASLLESSKRNGLYIDSVFSNKQEYIWTGDDIRDGSEDITWGISFKGGSVQHYVTFMRWRYFGLGSFVRPVRSGI
jgi:hypothetical protein